MSCEARPLGVRSVSLVERGFELLVLFVVLTVTKGLELRTAYEHRMAESERAVRVVCAAVCAGEFERCWRCHCALQLANSWAAGIEETCFGSCSFL